MFVITSSKEDLLRGGYRAIFHLGSGRYQCFPSWKDVLQRDRDISIKIKAKTTGKKKA